MPALAAVGSLISTTVTAGSIVRAFCGIPIDDPETCLDTPPDPHPVTATGKNGTFQRSYKSVSAACDAGGAEAPGRMDGLHAVALTDAELFSNHDPKPPT